MHENKLNGLKANKKKHIWLEGRNVDEHSHYFHFCKKNTLNFF